MGAPISKRGNVEPRTHPS